MVESFLYVFLVVLFPAAIYCYLAYSQARAAKNMSLPVLVSPVISIVVTTIYFLIFGSGGLDAGPIPVVVLWILIHLAASYILSIIIFKVVERRT